MTVNIKVNTFDIKYPKKKYITKAEDLKKIVAIQTPGRLALDNV